MKPIAIPFVLAIPVSVAILSPGSLAQGSDSCAGAQGVVGPGPHAFDLTTATTNPAEGQTTAACNVFGQTDVLTDVWFTWTAPAAGDFVVSTCQQTTVDTKVAIYPALGCPPGGAIWCDDDGCAVQSLLPFTATVGQMFLIQIGTSPFGSPGTGDFRVLPAPTGATDDCTTPASVSGTGFFGFNNNMATTGTQGQSNPGCPAATNDIWYSWTAPVTGVAQFDTCGQTLTDTKIAAYGGTGCPAGISIACDDDACGPPQSLVQWPVTSGAGYALQIGGGNIFTQSAGTFRLDVTPIPANDSCATPDTANPGGASYDNTMATTGAEGQGNPCGGIQKDLWFNWTASVNGTATISTCGTTAVNTSLAVYVGGGCPAGAALACSDDICGFSGTESELSISVTTGAVFRIQVGSSPGFPGGPAAISIVETPLGGGGTMTPMCFPGTGGVISCPCGQPANPAGGCANFGVGSTSGAVLNASGTASVGSDSVILTTTNHRLTTGGGVLNVFFSYKPGSATPTTGVGSGAGVRCIGTGGSLKRLYTGQAFGGSLSKPGMGDMSVSGRSASFPGHGILPPETRFYFNVYRDGQASGPCGSTAISTNLTNMGSIAWGP
ncbi:MAG: hypothetical protein ACKVXR_05965 [Planctomycetota bacterium]